MTLHSHEFIESYDGLVGYGLNRETDENTIIYYLQKFSDDRLMSLMRSRMSDDELEALFSQLSNLLRKHLSEEEYHRYFLKENR